MIKILITEFSSGYGGSASYLLSFLTYLDKTKFFPIIVMYEDVKGPTIEKIKSLSTKLFFLNRDRGVLLNAEKTKSIFITKILGYVNYLLGFILHDVLCAYKISKIIRKENVNLVMLNSDVEYNIPGALAAKFSFKPCIARKSGIGAESRQGYLIKRLFSTLVDVFIASSKAEMRSHLENKLPYRKIVTIYEGTDLNVFYPSKDSKIRTEYDIPDDEFLVGSISRLVPGKGQDDFIRAARIVLSSLPNTTFLIVGDDLSLQAVSYKKYLKEEVKRLNIEKKVIFTGWRKDIFDILQAIDIFVHCPNTWNEGMGIATLEAIACGKPTIVTANWGLVDTTIDKFNGFVVPIGDVERIAQNIIHLLRDSDLRNNMSLNARLLAEKEFDMGKNIKKIEAIIIEETTRK